MSTSIASLITPDNFGTYLTRIVPQMVPATTQYSFDAATQTFGDIQVTCFREGTKQFDPTPLVEFPGMFGKGPSASELSEYRANNEALFLTHREPAYPKTLGETAYFMQQLSARAVRTLERHEDKEFLKKRVEKELSLTLRNDRYGMTDLLGGGIDNALLGLAIFSPQMRRDLPFIFSNMSNKLLHREPCHYPLAAISAQLALQVYAELERVDDASYIPANFKIANSNNVAESMLRATKNERNTQAVLFALSQSIFYGYAGRHYSEMTYAQYFKRASDTMRKSSIGEEVLNSAFKNYMRAAYYYAEGGDWALTSNALQSAYETGRRTNLGDGDLELIEELHRRALKFSSTGK